MSAKRKTAPTTALARRPKAPDYAGKLETLARQVRRLAAVRAVEVLPPQQALEARVLTDVAQLGQLGLQPLTLSAEAETILAEPIDAAKVLILPTGAVYYPHIEYTRWFNRGFGRGAWAVVPSATPKMTPVPKRAAQFLVTQPFVLFVHGKAIAQTTAEHTYHENNAEQSHGDVVESLNASALRRLAKRLGIGLELWDRTWGRQWQASYALMVEVDGENRPQWRRTSDPPLWKEIGPWRGGRSASPRQGGERGAPGPGRTGAAREPQRTDDRKITPGAKGQVGRLWAIAKTAGRDKDEIKGYLRIRWGIESTSDITRGHYEEVIRDIQRPGPMVDTVARDPGEEG